MRGLFVSALFVSALGSSAALCGPLSDWVPPRPGEDTCSGFRDPGKQRNCREQEAGEARQREENNAAQMRALEAASAAADARIQAQKDEAEAKREAAQAALQAQIRQRQADLDARAEARARADAADDYKRVDVLDLQFKPEKYRGKKIKVANMQCYADPGDYRCTSFDPALDHLTPVSVMSSSVEPDLARSNFEQVCGSFRTATSSNCRVTLRFLLDDYTMEQNREGEDVLVLRPRSIVLTDEP